MMQDSEWECILAGDFNREWPWADSTSPPSDFQKAAGDMGLSNPTADALRALGDPRYMTDSSARGLTTSEGPCLQTLYEQQVFS
jgi:hypothetical protein